MRRVLRRALSVAAFLVFAKASAVQAQTGVYGQFTAVGASSFKGNYSYGGTFGFYQDHRSLGPVHLGYDFRGFVLKQGSQTTSGGLGGLRVSAVPHVVPFKFYGEALGGLNVRSQTGATTFRAFQYQFNGGVEYTVLPRVDWRVLEVGYSGYSGSLGSTASLSSGFVVRF